MSNPCPNAALINEAARVARTAFGLTGPDPRPFGGGRVHDTFLAESGGRRYILQRLNHFFQGHEAFGRNWMMVEKAVTGRSEQAGLWLPPIFPDLDGRYLTSLPDGEGFWRLTGYIDGQPAPRTPEGAREAARLLGKLHRFLNQPAPLDGLIVLPEGEYTNQRLTGPGDLEILTARYRRHPHLEELRPLIDAAGQAANLLPHFPAFLSAFSMRDLVTHGDTKADNFLFDPDGRALALLDWDSVGLGNILIDLGEMMRSWGVPGSPRPDGPPAVWENMAAVIEGYAETGLELTALERELLIPVLRGIGVNLLRRYLTDALAEVYFRWDHAAYPSLYHQNRARATTLLRLLDHLMESEFSLTRLLSEAYARGLERRLNEKAAEKNPLPNRPA